MACIWYNNIKEGVIIKTRYPIILVHGIVVKDFKKFKCFGKIEKVLKEQGLIVYTAKTDGFGTILSNAEQLKKYIKFVLEKENVDKVNIIAHSKGGLDAKYMITSLDMEDSVASLTTICTPHKGSPIASKLLKLPKWMLRFISFWINFWYKIFGDEHPDSLEVCKELKRVNLEEERVLMISDKVYCQSYSSKMNKSTDDFLMGIPYAFSMYFEHVETDGMVPVDSCVFGEYKGYAIDDSISHSEIIDFMVKHKKKEKVYKFYISVCVELIKKGF